MPQRLQDGDLAERLAQVLLVQTCLVYDFDGNLQQILRANRETDLAKNQNMSFSARLFVVPLVCLGPGERTFSAEREKRRSEIVKYGRDKKRSEIQVVWVAEKICLAWLPAQWYKSNFARYPS